MATLLVAWTPLAATLNSARLWYNLLNLAPEIKQAIIEKLVIR